MFDKSTPSLSSSRGPRLGPSVPPPCQSNEVASGPWIRLNNHGSADTPRNRFDYSVELRQYQQKHEWFASQIKQSMFGDTESQNKVARKWVVGQWQRWGIWNRDWPEDGPGSQERWGNGLPACLLAMELAWEIEHVVTIQQPVDVSKICDTKAPQSPGSPPLNWSWDLVATLAAERLLNRHREDGFPSSKIELPSVVFRQDLKSLSVNLPEPVQKLVATVEKWDDLSLPPGTQTERRDIFGDPIGMYTKASTLETDGAPDSDNEDGARDSDNEDEARDSDNEDEAPDSDIDYGKGLFGISKREASTLEAGGARNSGYETVRKCDNREDLQRSFGIRHQEASTLEADGARDSDNVYRRGRYVMTPLEYGRARDPAYQTVRKCANREDLRRFLGISDEQARILEANGACNSGYETVRPSFGMSHREASPLQEGVFLTKSGRALFGIPGTFEAGVARNSGNEQGRSVIGMSVWESSGRPVGDARNADNEETARTSGRQVEGARNSGNEEVLPKLGGARNSGNEEVLPKLGGARNSGNEEVLPKLGGARNSDIAEIAASIRAMRGSRRRERYRKPGERTVRQTQGGRIKKASKQARP